MIPTTFVLILLMSTSMKIVASGRSGEMCFPVGGPVVQEEPPAEISQGPPGKRGAVGPQGLKGDQGVIGVPGECACDPNEVEQLREHIRVFNRTVLRSLNEATDTLKRIDDQCNPNPCWNGATCFGRTDDYTCKCREGFDGNTCSRRIECVVPGPPLNGSVSSNLQSIPFQENITYSCDDGFVVSLEGNKHLTVTCEIDRTWSDDRPTCKKCALGMEDGRIEDSQISAKSRLSAPYYSEKHGRLHNQLPGDGSHAGSWYPASPYIGEWIQVDFEAPTHVVSVVTQGYPNGPYYVSTYKISYGYSANEMQIIQGDNGDLIFQGNTDGATPVENRFPSPITTRYIRLIVQAYVSGPYLRMEFMQC